ncbi:histone deacetylase [Angomonas deanei]|uniref:Histone deacetylase domain containing protein, putative n=1 Tax=Angomonas deanei TaxID=59799 RepID=A0A7G2CEX1_9TRYP|nr:histone deacetylase [Angomonas deanei]CAD2217531.1 Histone deacetylase domain containing protein, putative [Angomonas deanei]|eukprot:EPY19637.1 histone deacetylase [Angomonas deanei]
MSSAGKRARPPEEEGTERAAPSPALVQASNQRFQLYITRWMREVERDDPVLPSTLPELSPVQTILPPSSVHRILSTFGKSKATERHGEGGGRTGIVTDEDMLLHASSDAKDFERPLRLSRTLDHLKATGVLQKCVALKARQAKDKELRLVHSERHMDYVSQLDFVAGIKEGPSYAVDQDVYACQGTSRAARVAAGCAVQATLAVVEEQCANAFAIVRPPGHHAAAENASGFCFFNNVAVAARVAQATLKKKGVEAPKVLVLDWDVHHCDGTESIFYNDPSVLVVSIHQYGNRRGHILRKCPTVMGRKQPSLGARSVSTWTRSTS